MSSSDQSVLVILTDPLERNDVWTRLYPLVVEMARAALKLGPVESLAPDRQDLVAEAVYAALGNVVKYRRGFRGKTEGEARAWLRTLCRRAAWRLARRMRRRGRDIPTDAAELGEFLDEQALRESVHSLTAVAALAIVERALPNQGWRQIWLLHNHPGLAMSHEEIAAATGRTRGSVAVTLSHVRHALEREMRLA